MHNCTSVKRVPGNTAEEPLATKQAGECFGASGKVGPRRDDSVLPHADVDAARGGAVCRISGRERLRSGRTKGHIEHMAAVVRRAEGAGATGKRCRRVIGI